MKFDYKNLMQKKETKLVTKFYKKIGITKKETTNNIWEAIKIACTEIYPDITISPVINQYEAALLIGKRLSRQTLVNKAKDGYLRMNQTKFYEFEIQQIKILLDLADLLEKAKAVARFKDINENEVFAIIPTSLVKFGKSSVDQSISTIYHLYKSPVVKKFLQNYCEELS